MDGERKRPERLIKKGVPSLAFLCVHKAFETKNTNITLMPKPVREYASTIQPCLVLNCRNLSDPVFRICEKHRGKRNIVLKHRNKEEK
jgi:hypothetical protein